MDQADLLKFQADAAEFVTLDPQFRAAVNSADAADATASQQSAEIRQQVLSILLQDGNHLNQRIGRLRAMPSRSPVRLLALKFLDEFAKRTLSGISLDQSLTIEEQQKRQQAKDLYNTRHYQEALTLGLELIQQNPNLNNNLALVGFIAHCYNKLSNLENAYLWARRSLEMSPPGEEVIQKIDIIIRFCFECGRYEEIMDLVLKYPGCKQDRSLVDFVTRAAFKLKRYGEALEAAKNSVFYGGRMQSANPGILEIAVYSAVMLRDYEQALRFCKLYLKTGTSLFILQVAAAAAAKLGNSEASRMYRTEAEELEKRIDSRGCPEIEQMLDGDEEEE